MHMKIKKYVLLLVAAFLSFVAFNQEKKFAVISGTVKDAGTKLPLTEAVITLSSNAFEGQKFAITDSAGTYKINNLPPGNYSITFEMEGYEKFVHDTVSLKDGMVLGLDYEMVKEKKRKSKESR